MTTFEDFYKELCSDEIWKEQAGLNHKPETFEATARQIWVNGLAEGESFKLIPMRAHRQHLFNKLSKLPPDRPKKQWWVKDSDKEDVKPEAPPLTGEERERWLNIWNDTIKNTPAFKSTPKLTSQMIEEEGGVRPKAVQPYPATNPTEAYVRQRHLEYVRRNYEPMTGEKLPDWVEESEFNKLYDGGLI